MVPLIAAVLCLAFVAYLFRTDPRQEGSSTSALWIPFLWMFFAGSRYLSSWLSFSSAESFSYDEGSPLDRMLFLALIAAGVVVLVRRNVPWGRFMAGNKLLLLFGVVLGVGLSVLKLAGLTIVAGWPWWAAIRSGRARKATSSRNSTDEIATTAPEHAPAWSLRGYILLELQRLADASAAFDRALELDSALAKNSIIISLTPLITVNDSDRSAVDGATRTNDWPAHRRV